jgi:hypothetical protein
MKKIAINDPDPITLGSSGIQISFDKEARLMQIETPAMEPGIRCAYEVRNMALCKHPEIVGGNLWSLDYAYFAVPHAFKVNIEIISGEQVLDHFNFEICFHHFAGWPHKMKLK